MQISRSCLKEPRRKNRFLYRESEIDNIGYDLSNGGEYSRCAWRSNCHKGTAFRIENESGAHAGKRTLARFDRIDRTRSRHKVIHLVVHYESPAWDNDAWAEEVVYRLGNSYHIPFFIHYGEVSCRARFVFEWIAWLRRAHRCIHIDPCCLLLGIFLIGKSL